MSTHHHHHHHHHVYLLEPSLDSHAQGTKGCNSRTTTQPQETCHHKQDKTPWHQKNPTTAHHRITYLGGTMFPPPSDGLAVLPLSALWPSRRPNCRLRYWKWFLLLVFLLITTQFSLNILFYRNYDSLFYINITSSESVTSGLTKQLKLMSSRMAQTQQPAAVPSEKHQPLHQPAGSKVMKKNTISSVDIERSESSNASQHSQPQLPIMVQPFDTSFRDSDNIRGPLGLDKEKSIGRANKIVKNPRIKNNLSPSKYEKVSTAQSEIVQNAQIRNSQNEKVLSGVTMKKGLRLKYDESSSNNISSMPLKNDKPLCPPVPPNLIGGVEVYSTVPTLEEQERLHPELEPGGRFRPPECRSRYRVAVIVPYRDRVEHLARLIYNLHPILERQQLDYAIYVVEQAGSGKFNRAMLLNVGSLEALKQYKYDCFIFHDVDLLPEDDRNLYTCPEQPRHMSIAIDTMGYKLPYNDIFGGVSAMSVDQFRTVNGFSNKFWGWGGEDDDMSNRIKVHGYFISRYPANIGRYSMLTHKKDDPNPRRYQFLYEGKKRFNSDGLNSAKYRALDVQLRRLYTWVYVDLYPS